MSAKEERDRRKELLPEIARRYIEEPDTDFESLAEQYKIPISTLKYYFRNMGVSRRGQDKLQRDTHQVILREEAEALSGEAEKIATIAIGLGGVITRRYLPLLDNLMSEGKTLEMIAEEIMGWYETKAATQANEDKLKADISKLNTELGAAYAISMPNFKYWLRTKILTRYMNQLLNARLMGVRLNVRGVLKALENDLFLLDSDVKEVSIGGEVNEFITRKS